jgi:hypothetical protein
MRPPSVRIIGALLACLLVMPGTAPATDVDGPNDCLRVPVDFGDAPESVNAYPAVPGRFPTCINPGPVGTRTFACPPISTVPGLTGYVRHQHPAAGGGYWLGCPPVGFPPQGIDPEADGKMNATGLGASACNTSIVVDCAEAAFGMTFGQDECYGSTDAGIAAPLNFATCVNSSVAYSAYNCGPTRQVYLNVLVDWNQDGDWNDNFQCATACAYEWAVKNVLIVLPPGCSALTTPVFMSGPNTGQGWLRITLSDELVNNDFPWAGSATTPPLQLTDGETEDYPVTIGHPCPEYEDWGDAPELSQAYPGVFGRFPTCSAVSGPGTQDIVPLCPPISTPPGPTGFVRHISLASDPFAFWLGCGTPGVDTESDGKTNDTGGPFSNCNTTLAVDCFETNFTLTFGQDECYGDGVDAGIDPAKLKFTSCEQATVDYKAFNCKNTTEVYLNILVDMNQDGDWNDNFICPGPTVTCAYEWAVKNVLIPLAPGCNVLTSPSFLMGPNAGNGWLRITLTATPVSNDFPWDGSAGGPGGQGFFYGGETEDYPVEINGNCQIGYRDFGDAPEEVPAYPTGFIGHFPTCLFASGPGTQEIDCGLPLSTPPGPTGYVMHLALAADVDHFWLGCPLGAVDGEADGKMNIGGVGIPSTCNQGIPVDCTEFIGAMPFGQDECYGDADAGLPSFVSFARCSTQAVRMNAYNCSDHNVVVYLNLLVDWNQDADWNDNTLCFQNKICAPEWAVKNVVVTLLPGCNVISSPTIQVGPREGDAWMRITISSDPVPDDFPWNGSASIAGGALKGGETEDYPVRITPSLVSVEDGQPGGLWLAPIVPNPAMNGVLLRYSLPRDEQVSLAAYDLAGRRLALLESGRMTAGEHKVNWNFRDEKGAPISAGYYVVKLRAGDRVLMQRGIRIR